MLFPKLRGKNSTNFQISSATPDKKSNKQVCTAIEIL